MHSIPISSNMLSAALKRISPNTLRAGMSTSVNRIKLEYFEERMKDGWDLNGPLKSLHLNVPHRRGFILDELERKGLLNPGSRPLRGLKVLDVGCGAGLMTETMAAFGADVTGIDPAETAILTARDHAQTYSPSLMPRIRYYSSTAEEHVKDNVGQYDVIMAFFVLEHINHRKQFLNNCTSMLKSDGSLFIQHLNRTWRNYLWLLRWHMYVTKLLPMGVATYSQLLSTDDIVSVLKSSGCEWVKTQGINAKLQGSGFYLTKSFDYINIIHAVKTRH